LRRQRLTEAEAVQDAAKGQHGARRSGAAAEGAPVREERRGCVGEEGGGDPPVRDAREHSSGGRGPCS